LIRPSTFLAGAALLAALSISQTQIFAQQEVPSAPEHQAVPAAPATPETAPGPVFPKIDPANFTATMPTVEAVNKFLQNSWGYDPNRVWQVQGILKTPAEGISKVVVLIGEKGGDNKLSALQFFALADGKHIIAGDDVIPFGDNPYADYRAMLQQRADGPYRGSAAKDLELVEFADFECPHCKAAQANMEKLAVDFPKARIVYQNYPLIRIHPQAFKAAEYGACVAKLGGSTAFFSFANAVYDGQEGLATAEGATLTLNSAVTKVGLDPVKVAGCAATPAINQQVAASVKLAQDLNINQTPTLLVNGRQVPLGGIAYETLKKIVEYQAKLDGVAAQ